MRIQSCCFALIFLANFTSAATLTIPTPHAEIRYDGISEKQASAIATTISTARDIYIDDFGFDMPETILCTITAKTGQTMRLYNDGLDRLILTMPAASKLDRPEKSGVFNLYGLCHELGHLAMYRLLKNHDWLTSAGAEGWAHYSGSYVVDQLYAKKGDKLWPDPYDYRADGMARLKKQLAAPSPDEITRAAGQWMDLEKILGRKEFPNLFKNWQSAQIDRADPTPAISKILLDLKPDQKPALEKWLQSAAPLLIEKREASAFKAQTIAPAKLSGKPIEIAQDDGTEESKSSLAGGAHARQFSAPGPGDWYLTRIDIRAARYGPPRAPATDFEIALCDDKNKPIATWKKPYSLAPRAAQLDWIRIDLPPTKVPADFTINFAFNPTASSGIYVGYDSSTTGHSHTSTPGSDPTPFSKGDWMIRPHLDQPKSADALK